MNDTNVLSKEQVRDNFIEELLLHLNTRLYHNGTISQNIYQAATEQILAIKK